MCAHVSGVVGRNRANYFVALIDDLAWDKASCPVVDIFLVSHAQHAKTRFNAGKDIRVL